jgi:hypothetical protein
MDDFDKIFDKDNALDCPLLEETDSEEWAQHKTQKSKRIKL